MLPLALEATDLAIQALLATYFAAKTIVGETAARLAANDVIATE